MSLMQCPECGNKVSTEAETCVNCGFPLMPRKYWLASKDHEKNWFALMLRILGIVVWACGLVFAYVFARIPQFDQRTMQVSIHLDATIFLLTLLTAGIIGAFLFGFATVVEDIRSIRNHLSTMQIFDDMPQYYSQNRAFNRNPVSQNVPDKSPYQGSDQALFAPDSTGAPSQRWQDSLNPDEDDAD